MNKFIMAVLSVCSINLMQAYLTRVAIYNGTTQGVRLRAVGARDEVHSFKGNNGVLPAGQGAHFDMKYGIAVILDGDNRCITGKDSCVTTIRNEVVTKKCADLSTKSGNVWVRYTADNVLEDMPQKEYDTLV